jgi:hypothetical protein
MPRKADHKTVNIMVMTKTECSILRKPLNFNE